MARPVFINANEFIEALKAQGLLIVSVNEFEAKKDLLRKRLLKRESVTVKEIVEHGLLPLRSKTSVMHWIENGKIRQNEVVRESSGKNRVLILTSAITRLGYGV